jgi:RHS repeat-associated protein
VVPRPQSRFPFLAAGRIWLAAVLLWLCGVLPAGALHAPDGIPISPKTRVGGFGALPAGRLPLREQFGSINAPGKWGCGYEIVSGRREWKLYGPDAKGKYATQNGTGCLDAVSPYLSLFNPLISDYRGDILAEVTNGVVRWNPARPTGYGAVPGYRPVALGSGADISLASAWRGHWPDITGYYNLGLRLYDPVAGMWLSYDSVVDPNNPNGCSAFGGDPINGFDSDGRCVENAGLKALGGAFHFLFSASYEEDAQPMDEQIAATYDANYKYYGNSSLYALNATFNPAVSTELNAGETFGGMGLNYNDSGQTLSYAQQVDAGGSSILGVGQTAAAATMIYGAGTLAYSQVSQLSSSWVTPGTQVIDDGWVEQLQQQQQTGPAPQAPLTVDPGTLRLPPTRAEGADPFKLSQQMQQYGDSTEGMPPIQVTQGLNGEMMINDGVTRATRISTYNQINTTVNQVPVIVIEQTAQDFSHLPTVGGPK